MAFLRRTRPDPDSQPNLTPADLSMTIADIFWIGPAAGAELSPAQRAAAAKAPGTVLSGELTGAGTLKPGDWVLHEDDRFQILGIKAFRENLESARPPRNIGVVLGTTVAKERFSQGQQLRFER
jgi:hypothetical protein